MFLYEGSLIGSLVALAVPLAAAVNFTILQHVGLGKGKVIAPNDEPVQDMLQTVLIGATLSALATLPLSLPFQASAHDLDLLSLLSSSSLPYPVFLLFV